MPLDYPNNPGQLEELRSQITEQLEKISKHTKLETIAELTGAKEFLKYENVGHGKTPVAVLDVKAFCEYLLMNNKTIKLPESYTNTGRVILPPDEGEIITGSGKGIEKKEIIPRDIYLVQLLGELRQDYYILDGHNTPNMMRSLSYKIFVIPGLKKAVFVNNEEGNATYIIHNLEQTDKEEVLEFAKLTKEQLRHTSEDEQISLVIWSGESNKWKEEIKNRLSLEFKPKRKTRTNEQKSENRIGIEKAGEGFVTNGILSRGLGVAYRTIEKIADKYRENNPQWFVKALDKGGRVAEHYHPELVAIISKEIRTRPEKAAEGFITNTGLADLLGVGQKIIEKTADKYRESNPQWFVKAMDKTGKVREHYHPSLVMEITKEIQSRPEKAGEGFMTLNALASELKISIEIIEKIADTYRESHPQWFVKALDKVGKVSEHYHPSLVMEITKEIQSRPEKAGEGFMTLNALASELGVDRKTIGKIAEKYRTSNPEWFVRVRDKTGKVAEHYHPELQFFIKKEVQSRPEKVVEGYVTNRGLAEELGEIQQAIKKIADKYRESHPQWFVNALNELGRAREHYHPDLIAIISEEINKKKNI